MLAGGSGVVTRSPALKCSLYCLATRPCVRRDARRLTRRKPKYRIQTFECGKQIPELQAIESSSFELATLAGTRDDTTATESSGLQLS